MNSLLERLTKLGREGSEADDDGGDDQEGAVEVCVALVSDAETSELVDPGESALHDPAVLAEMLAALDAASGDARRDPAGTKVAAAAAEIVALVGVQFGRSL